LERISKLDQVYGENLRLQKGTFWLSLKLLLLSSPEEELWFSALEGAKEVKTSRFFLYSQGRRKGARPPKFVKNWGLIMGFYTLKYQLAFKQDPLRKNRVG
jgi:hypothetical protein